MKEKSLKHISQLKQKFRFRTRGGYLDLGKENVLNHYSIKRSIFGEPCTRYFSATFIRTNYTTRQLIIFKSAFYAQ